MNSLMQLLFTIPRPFKRAITLACDVFFISTSLLMSLYIRIGEGWINFVNQQMFYFSCTLIIITIGLWIRLGLYRAVIRYMDVRVLATIFYGAVGSVITLVFLSFIFRAGLPRSIPFIYFALILIFVAGSRLLIRGFINAQNVKQRKPVIIYGAGSSGRQLCLSLQNGTEYIPVAFVDDSEQLHGSLVSGVKVYSAESITMLSDKYQIEKILFAIPSASVEQKREIFNRAESLHIEMLTIPGSADLVSGKINLAQLRSVDINDLLGREPVVPNQKLMSKCIQGKSVMVTGAGGSIGSELCRQIATQKPKCIILFEHSEYNLYAIEQYLLQKTDVPVYPVLGTVLNSGHIDDTIKFYNVETIYHAAAYKHVPLVEQNNVSGLNNNIWGTKIVAECAMRCGVGHFVLISTDKAVRPTNLMGASKRVAELVIQRLSEVSSSTVFSMVRFGNVLGSSGSVVPLFRKQIERGGPVTVTHPEITRFFMTIPEAASLVIQAGAMAMGGEVFVLDMGQPVKIVELAEKMVHLMGYEIKNTNNPTGDIAIEFTGLRPGEKLYEELLIGGDVEGTEHPRIMRAKESSIGEEDLESLLSSIKQSMECRDVEKIRELLIKAPTGYVPESDIVDVLTQRMSSITNLTPKPTKTVQ